MKSFKTIFIVLTILLISVFLYKGVLEIEDYLQDKISNSKSAIPKDYFEVLKLDSNLLEHPKSIFVDDTNVISSFAYDNQFNIIIFKINSISSEPLSRTVNISNKLIDLDIDGGTIYQGIETGMIKMNYRPDYRLYNIDSIMFQLPKANIYKKLIENDSTCAFFIYKSSGFKARLNDKKSNDLIIRVLPEGFFGSKKFMQEKPMNILLLTRKKHGSIYLILVHKTDGKAQDITDDALRIFINNEPEKKHEHTSIRT